RAPVERLHRHAIRHVRRLNGRDDQLRKSRRIRRVRAALRRDLGPDIEAHGLAARLAQVEQLREPGEALTIDGLLPGKLPTIWAHGIDASKLVALELGE